MNYMKQIPPAFYRTRRFGSASTTGHRTVRTLGQINPVHAPIPHFLKMHLTILTSTPSSYKWAVSFRFHHWNPVCNYPLTDTCYMPRPTHSYRSDHPNYIWCRVHTIKVLTAQSSPLPCYLGPITPKYLSRHPTLEHLQFKFFPQRKGQTSHP